MSLHQVVDRQHGGMVAWALSHPDDWSAQSEVVWNYQNTSFPVVSYAQAQSPDGSEAFEFLPAESLYWLQPDFGFCRPGQQTLGQTAMQPMPAADTLVRWILPKYAGLRQQIHIVLAGQVPDLAGQLKVALQGLPSEGAAVRLTYVENGQAFEEELFGLQVRQDVPYHGPQGMTLQINWGMARLFRFRALAGTLESRRNALWQIAASAKVNLAWEHVCAQVNRQLQQQFDQYIQMGYSQIQAAGQLNRAISANNDAMLAGFQQQRQAAAHASHSSAATAIPTKRSTNLSDRHQLSPSESERPLRRSRIPRQSWRPAPLLHDQRREHLSLSPRPEVPPTLVWDSPGVPG